MTWKTIDDGAPKDGTQVDLWVNGERWTDCAWDAEWEGKGAWIFHTFGDSYPVDGTPTHWQPLPDPPG